MCVSCLSVESRHTIADLLEKILGQRLALDWSLEGDEIKEILLAQFHRHKSCIFFKIDARAESGHRIVFISWDASGNLKFTIASCIC